MKAEVDSGRCQGHTLCSMIAPERFILDDVDGHASAAPGEIPVNEESAVREAVASCPERAISLSPERGGRSGANVAAG